MAGLERLRPIARRIAITQRRAASTPAAPQRDVLETTWHAWFTNEMPQAQFVAVPNFDAPGLAVQYVVDRNVDALLLSGGEDIGSHPGRDAVEAALLQHALERGWPVIGVCRGMQFLQRATGGELIELAGHVGVDHAVQTNGGAAIVNSWHRWGVRQPGADWETLASAADGSVEAMRHRARPWLELMWHPERSDGGAAVARDWIEAVLASRLSDARA